MKTSAIIIIGILFASASSAAVAEHRKQYGSGNGLGTPTYLEKMRIKTGDFHRKGFITDKQYKKQIRSMDANQYYRAFTTESLKNARGRGRLAR